MRKLKKCLAVLAVFAIMVVAGGGAIMACTKTPNCEATGVTVECGSGHGSTSTHYVAYPNGYVNTCVITKTEALHKIKCSGCDALIKTEYRQCSEEHSDSHCFDRYNMCK